MTKAAPVVEVTDESTSLDAIAKNPETIKLFGHVLEVMEEMIVLARSGYRVFPGITPTVYHTGSISVLLQRGEPLALAVQRAKESIAREQKAEAAMFEKRVQQAAQQIAAEQAQRDLEARVAAAQAVADAQVQRIREDAEAAIARIVANV